MSSAEFCTCRDTKCPNHPSNHERGCTLCIAKCLKLGEIPSCFFNHIGHPAPQPGYSISDFAHLVVRDEEREERS